MPKLCTSCFQDSELKALVNEEGLQIESCAICESSNVPAMDCESTKLRSLFRALYRYHFSEWEYNSHMGGDGLEGILLKENPLTSYNPSWNKLDYEDAIIGFLDEGYEPYETGISLFAGYGHNQLQNSPLISLKSTVSPALRNLKTKLQEQNYFLLEETAGQLVADHIDHIEKTVAVGDVMHRARIGYNARATPLEGWAVDWEYQPFEGHSLTAPPPPIAAAGRLNRPGVSFLYLSGNAATAVAEVRPHPGHQVSLGQFECLRPLRIADFNSVSIRDHCQSDKDLDQFVFLKSIDTLFSLPIPPEDRGKYSFTQFLADVIRRLGHDGVGYRSSVGTAPNLAIFDPATYRFVSCSGKVVNITELNYDYVELVALDPDADYMTDLEGNYLQ